MAQSRLRRAGVLRKRETRGPACLPWTTCAPASCLSLRHALRLDRCRYRECIDLGDCVMLGRRSKIHIREYTRFFKRLDDWWDRSAVTDNGQLTAFVVKCLEPRIVRHQPGERLDDFDRRLLGPLALDEFLGLRQFAAFAGIELALERIGQFACSA